MAMVYRLMDTVKLLLKLCDVEVLSLHNVDSVLSPALPRAGPTNLHFLSTSGERKPWALELCMMFSYIRIDVLSMPSSLWRSEVQWR